MANQSRNAHRLHVLGLAQWRWSGTALQIIENAVGK